MSPEMLMALICVFFLGMVLGLAANLERIGRIARWRAAITNHRISTEVTP